MLGMVNKKEIEGLKELHKNELETKELKIEELKNQLENKDKELKQVIEMVESLTKDANREMKGLKTTVINSINSINDNLQNQSASQEENTASLELLEEAIIDVSSALELSAETVKNDVEAVKVFDKNIQSMGSEMQELNSDVVDISSIVEVINEITSQINLLALNAQIESARAGEAGRGFSVVANEVKNLAEKVKQSNDYIKKNVENVQKKSAKIFTMVEEGVKTSKLILDGSITREVNISKLNEKVEDMRNNASQLSSSNQEATANSVNIAEETTTLCLNEHLIERTEVIEIREPRNVIGSHEFANGSFEIKSGNDLAFIKFKGLVRGDASHTFATTYGELKKSLINVSNTSLVIDAKAMGIFPEESKQAVKGIYKDYTTFKDITIIIGDNELVKTQLVTMLKELNILDKYKFVQDYRIN